MENNLSGVLWVGKGGGYGVGEEGVISYDFGLRNDVYGKMRT